MGYTLGDEYALWVRTGDSYHQKVADKKGIDNYEDEINDVNNLKFSAQKSYLLMMKYVHSKYIKPEGN